MCDKKRRPPQGEMFVSFFEDTLKTAFELKTEPIDAHKQDTFFLKLEYHLPILKRQRRPPTLALASCAPELIYFLN